MACVTNRRELQAWMVAQDGVTNQVVAEYMQQNPISHDIAEWFARLSEWLKSVDWESKKGDPIIVPAWIKERTEHAEHALSELSQWLAISQDRNKTLHLWSEAFIRCGSCKRSWDAWVLSHPVSDPIDAWVEFAQAEIRKNGWV